MWYMKTPSQSDFLFPLAYFGKFVRDGLTLNDQQVPKKVLSVTNHQGNAN